MENNNNLNNDDISINKIGVDSALTRTYDASPYVIKTTDFPTFSIQYNHDLASDGVCITTSELKNIIDMHREITTNEFGESIHDYPNDKNLNESEVDGLVMRIYCIGFKRGSRHEHFHAPNFQVVYNSKQKSFSLPEVAYENLQMSFMADIMNSGASINKAVIMDKELCKMSTCITDIYADGRTEIFYPRYDDVYNASYSKQKMFKKKIQFTEISW